MNRSLLQVFEEYQKARVQFVQTIADLATRPQNIDTLRNAGAMALLRPLLLDDVPSIQQSAALALGRISSYSEDLAEALVKNDVLRQLVESMSTQNRFYKKAAAFVFRAVAKHTPQLAQAVVDSGALRPLVSSLEEFDASVKESVAWALGYIARHSLELAQAVVDAGAVPLLVLCFQEPELSLRRISASALSDICKHSAELAQVVVDAGTVSLLAQDISHIDAPLKRQVCSCLSQIAKHSLELSEMVVEADIFPRILHILKDPDECVRKNAATCIREIAKHSADFAKLIVTAGGVPVLVDYVTDSTGNQRLPGIMALGYISAFSEALALSVIVAKGIPPLKDALVNESEDHIRAASAWSLGQMGRHSPDHSRALAEGDVLRRLLNVYLQPDGTDDLKLKTKRAFKNVVQKTTYLPALEPLITETPLNLLEHVLQQFAKILPSDVQARRSFVQSGGLQNLLEIKGVKEGSKLQDIINEVNNLYPPEIVNYYSPGYSDVLIKRLEEYEPSSTST